MFSHVHMFAAHEYISARASQKITFLLEFVLCSQHITFGNQIQVIGFGGKHLCP